MQAYYNLIVDERAASNSQFHAIIKKKKHKGMKK
jgi:hypothetical protein